jgi:oxalate decarboxylase/phosphoglucose isomerase-like protein (cupin superfamily)
MPDATAMAGVDMRLEAGAYRELHWHVAAEWSLVLNGSCRIQVCFSPFHLFKFADRQAINENGETFIDDVSEGDIWFFPPYVTSHLTPSMNKC